MRVCAVYLPELRIELVREQLAYTTSSPPLAVVVAPAPMSESKLLGNTRLSAVSREARGLGVAAGQTIAEARARAGELVVRVVRPDAVRDVLARIAEVGLAFGATVSFGMAGDSSSRKTESGARGRSTSAPASDFGDVVWIDVTGCAHLHASRGATTIFDGETILASRLARVMASMGHVCSVAIADGPRVAAMVARAAAERALMPGSARARAARAATRASRRPELSDLEPIVVPTGDSARALAPLSVAALPIATSDVRWLVKLGVRTIEAMRALPRDGLGSRLGACARDVLSLAFGEDRAPLVAYVPPAVPEEEVELEYGVEGVQSLLFVTKTLTDRLSARLRGRAVAAARIELELRLDTAVLRDSAEGGDVKKSVLVGLDLPAPLTSASDLLAALRPRIDRLVLEAPVLGAALRAPMLVHTRATELSLFDPRPKAERALPRLVAELVADLGQEAVSTLVLGDSWAAEDRSRFVGFTLSGDPRAASSTPEKTKRRLLSSVPEPTRLLPEPRPLGRDEVRITRHLSRVEAVEWWKTLPSRQPGARRRKEETGPERRIVDYVQAWTHEGGAWVEIDRATGAMFLRGWFD